MALKIKGRPGNIRRLEASIKGGIKALSGDLRDVIIKGTHDWAKGLIKAIQSDSRFTELKTNPDLRGVLGMPQQQFRKGSDTDAEDLIKLLQSYTVATKSTTRSKKITIRLPTLTVLEQRLVRQLSTISAKGGVIGGPTQSWFRWWEFGDQGEITSLTILRRNIGKLAASQGRRGSRGRSALNKLISNRSRSGSAIQIASIAGSTGIVGRNLVSEKYSNFGKIFPARIGKLVSNYIRNNRTQITRLFARTRVT